MKILFISHEATRSGAPILLLNLLRWLKQNTDVRISVLLMQNGELLSEFQDNCDSLYLLQPSKLSKSSFIKRLFNKTFRIKIKDPEIEYTERLYQKIKEEQFDLLYGNTIVSISVIHRMIKTITPQISCVVHVHEMNSMLKYFTQTIDALKEKKIQYIAVSSKTRILLEQTYNVKAQNISLIYAYLDFEYLKRNEQVETPAKNDKFVVHGSGYASIRKGYDIFILVAKRAIQKYPTIPFLFRWIGMVANETKTFIEIDLENMELSDRIVFTGGLSAPFYLYKEAHAFVLTSREDPFPLVSLEHSFFGVPTVCFDKATGITEFVENDAGVIVPYLDIEAMVDALADLFNDETKRKSFGEIAKIKIANYDASTQIPKIYDIIINQSRHL